MTLKEALKIIRKLQPLAKSCGFYVGLAGGVLYNGKSEHDLDLILLPDSRAARLQSSKFDEGIRLLGFSYRADYKKFKHVVVNRLSFQGFNVDIIVPRRHK